MARHPRDRCGARAFPIRLAIPAVPQTAELFISSATVHYHTEFIDTLISEVIECPILEVFGRHREGYSRRDYTNAGQGANL